MSARRLESGYGTGQSGEAVILFTVGDVAFAIAARDVEEIRNTEGLRALRWSSPSPKLQKLRHRFERGGRPYYVVDASTHFQMMPLPATRLLVLRERAIAVLVGGIERMAEIQALYPVPRAFTGRERHWYRGLALLPGSGGEMKLVPVVSADAFLTTEEAAMAPPLSPAQGAEA